MRAKDANSRSVHETGSPDPRRFRPTRWSMVLRSRGNDTHAHKALEELCQLYWFPLYAWCRARGKSAHDAEDLIQGFFLKILQNELLHTADPSKGKLRTFLLTALQRFIRDQDNISKSSKRGAGNVISIDPATAEACYMQSSFGDSTPEETYDRQWAFTVLDHAIGALEDDAKARGKRNQFLAMRPFLTDQGSMESYARAAEGIGMTVRSFKVAVHRLRARFREQLHLIVRDTQLEGDSDPSEEVAYLAKVLAQG